MSAVKFTVIIITILLQVTLGLDIYHKGSFSTKNWKERSFGRDETDAEANFEYWRAEALSGLRERLVERERERSGVARDVVMFLGDGMSLATLAAARAHKGQREGRTGEGDQLSFEAFPTVGLVKTYCVDAQTADSACSATAYLCGAKANYGTLGVTSAVPRRDCSAATDRANQLHSIAAWALLDGRHAGLVTTTRVTHASPAGLYAHSAERDWESDADVSAACAGQPRDRRQPDIALQLIRDFPGNQFKVILGGGRREFLPNDTIDEEGFAGRRLDGRNLIQEWRTGMEARGVDHQYVWNRNQLLNATSSPPEYLLGLFESDHLQYNLLREPATEPTLAELTAAAIATLSARGEGFFLFVEGGRIDHAHHEARPRLALDETLALHEAVARATELLDPARALVLVTSDHAHSMSYNGYSSRGSDVLGISDDIGDDGVPYTTLSYANGPGFRPHVAEGVRKDITQYDYRDPLFRFPGLVPLESETHGGEDVAVFAWGARHGVLSGLFEQSQLPHRVAYAACLPYHDRPSTCQHL